MKRNRYSWGLNIDPSLTTILQQTYKESWVNQVKYLGIMITFPPNLLESNLTLRIASIQQQQWQWVRHKISWFGRIATIKLNILPRWLFLFQNIVLDIPQQKMNYIQVLFNRYVGLK